MSTFYDFLILTVFINAIIITCKDFCNFVLNIALGSSPDGKKFRSRTQLADFFASEGITDLTAGDFDFSVRGIHKGVTPVVKKPAKKAVGRPSRSKDTASPVTSTLAQKLVIKMSFPSVRTSQKGSDDEDVEEPVAKGKQKGKGGKGKGSAKKGKQKLEDKDAEKVPPRKRGRPPKLKPDAEAQGDLPASTPGKRGRKRKTPPNSEVAMGEEEVKSPDTKEGKGDVAPESADVSAEETPVKSPAKRGRKPKLASSEKVVVAEVHGSALEPVCPIEVAQEKGKQDTTGADVSTGANEPDMATTVASQPPRRGRGRPKKVKASDPATTETPDVSQGDVVLEKKSDEQEMPTDNITSIPDEPVATPKRRGRKPARETQPDPVSEAATGATVATPRRRGRKRASESETLDSDTAAVSVATPKRRGRKPSVTSETATVEVHAIPRDVTVDESDVVQKTDGQNSEVTEASHMPGAPSEGSTVAVDALAAKPSQRGRKRAAAIAESENTISQIIEPAPIELGPRVRRKSWRLSDSLYDSGEVKPRAAHRKNSSNRNKTTAAKHVTVASEDNTTTAEASELYTMLKVPSGGNSTAAQMDMIADKLAKASDLHELSNIEQIPKLPPSNILSDFSSNWEFLDNSDVPPAVASTSQMDLGPRDDVECYSTDLMIPSEQGEPNADISLDVKSPVQLDHSYYCVNPRMQKVAKSKSPPIAYMPVEKIPPKLTTGGSPAGKRTKVLSERKIVRSPKGADDTTGGGDFVKSLPATGVTASDFFMSSSGDNTVPPQQGSVATLASGSDQQKVTDVAAGSSLSRTSVDAGAYILLA